MAGAEAKRDPSMGRCPSLFRAARCQCRLAMMEPVNDRTETLDILAAKYGEGMTIAVLPQAPLTIPYVVE
ncbi:MAG: hypothetical protein WD469_02640 [Paenibacillaceae bacterium]